MTRLRLPFSPSTGEAEIEILQVGSRADRHGRPVAITRSDLEAMVKAYNGLAGSEDAPLTIGEPKLADPAYGWVENLTLQADSVVAKARHLMPAFAEAVRAAPRLQIRTTFYPPNHASNPAAGCWYPKHVSFLGIPPIPNPLAAAFVARSGGTVAIESEIKARPAPIALKLPGGYYLAQMSNDDRALYQRALAIQADHPDTRFGTAMNAARMECETALYAATARVFSEQQAALLKRAAQMRALNPKLSLRDAQLAARSEIDATANTPKR